MAHAPSPILVLVENIVDGALRMLVEMERRDVYMDLVRSAVYWNMVAMMEYMLLVVGHIGAVEIMLG